tara:strand:- start:635 stop:880 length:246 start_codon:yes stop_codon:yes gene_type:complete
MSKKIESVYLVTYNTEYDDDVQIEGFLLDEADFDKWLDKHNEERWNEVACGEEDKEEHINKECSCFEGEDEFDTEEIGRLI